jgi:hypothetical protein
LSATYTYQLKTGLPAETVGKLIYYFGFFLDNIPSYLRKDKYLMAFYRIEIAEKRDEAYVVKWSYRGFMASISEYITIPTRTSVKDGDLIVSGRGTSFNFTVTFNVKRDKETIVNTTIVCTGRTDRCQEFLEPLLALLQYYIREPPPSILSIVTYLPPVISVAPPTPPTPPTPPKPVSREAETVKPTPTPPIETREVKPTAPTTRPTVVTPPKAKSVVSPEEALDPVNLAMKLIKAPLVASIDFKPNWSIKDLLAFFTGSSSRIKEYTYVVATMRSNGELDVSILLDPDGNIAAWRGLIKGVEHEISEPEKLLGQLQEYTSREVKVRIWGVKK